MDSCVIRASDVFKSYGNLAVLRGLTLDVRQGEIYGFLGPNGSGKSTTIMILLGLVRPDGGSCELFGQPTNRRGVELWRRIGVVPEHQYLYQEMTVWEYMAFFAQLYQVRDAKRSIERWLEVAGLTERRGGRIAHLSNGQRQRLSIVRALIHDPDLLILDEPVQGLDPASVRDLRKLIRTANQEGKTIFLSSHVLSEVEKTAHRVGILHQGRLLVEDTMGRLHQQVGAGTGYSIEVAGLCTQIVDALSAQAYVRDVAVHGSFLTIWVPGGDDQRIDISRIITVNGGYIIGWRQQRRTLEDVFFAATEAAIAGRAVVP